MDKRRGADRAIPASFCYCPRLRQPAKSPPMGWLLGDPVSPQRRLAVEANDQTMIAEYRAAEIRFAERGNRGDALLPYRLADFGG